MSTAAKTLTTHNWIITFDDGVKGSISFTDQRFSASAGPGSNATGGEYHLVGEDKIQFGRIMSTMMMPAPEAQARQSVLNGAFGLDPVPFKIDSTDEDPKLILNDKVVFVGSVTPEAKYGVPATTGFFDLHPTSEYPSKWKWRRVTYDENFVKTTFGEWKEYTLGSIQNAQHAEQDPTHEYRLRVNEFIVDGQTKATIFDMIVQCSVVEKQ